MITFVDIFKMHSMIFLDPSSILSDIINGYHQLIPVVNRFGVKMGVGDKTIAEICAEYDINTDFFLVILNTYLNEEYFPEKKLQKFGLDLVVNYLNESDNYIHKAQLYNLEKHLNAFITMSDPSNNQFKLIRRLFMHFKDEMNKLAEQTLVTDMDTAIELLHDMKNIFIKHISGTFNENMCYAVIFTIDSIERDLEKHNRIRSKVLIPMIDDLKKSGVEDWQELLTQEVKVDETHHAISQRELDVLRLVALGYLNKEIADKLNISLNTVLSHRKNITAKLGIKTVSGLIFYCITHGHISADEIEL